VGAGEQVTLHRWGGRWWEGF